MVIAVISSVLVILLSVPAAKAMANSMSEGLLVDLGGDTNPLMPGERKLEFLSENNQHLPTSEDEKMVQELNIEAEQGTVLV